MFAPGVAIPGRNPTKTDAGGLSRVDFITHKGGWGAWICGGVNFRLKSRLSETGPVLSHSQAHLTSVPPCRCSEWTQAARCVRTCCATPREPVMLALMEELDSLYERARKQPAPEPQQGGYCHIIETGTAETKAGTSPVSDYSHREA